MDTRPEPTDVPTRKNLVVDVDEKTTGHVSFGAGSAPWTRSSASRNTTKATFQAPWFRGGGQKLRLRVTVGTERQDYEMTFIEPWFLGRKLQFSYDLYYHDYAFLSPNDLYTETRGGIRSVLSALWAAIFSGGASATRSRMWASIWPAAANQYPAFSFQQGNVPHGILDTTGHHILSTAGTSLAYDTRNSVKLPNKGQRTELIAQLTGGPLGGSYSFYKLEAHSARYFRGCSPGTCWNWAGARAWSTSSPKLSDVPFFERYYLGGLYSLRGFKYRYISPRQLPNIPDNEPIGGDTLLVRLGGIQHPHLRAGARRWSALRPFYDVGSVGAKPYNPNFSDFSDNWGLGLRLNLPIGPLRLDYGIPIRHDQYSSAPASSSSASAGSVLSRPRLLIDERSRSPRCLSLASPQPPAVFGLAAKANSD